MAGDDLIQVSAGGGDSRGGNADASAHPHGLFDIVSIIERTYRYEQKGVDTSGEAFTSKLRWFFREVGFKSALVSIGLSVLFVPLAVGAFHGMIPVFGEPLSSPVDKAFVVALAGWFGAAYTAYLSFTALRHRQTLTRQMVQSLLIGVTLGAILVSTVAVILFYFLTFRVLNNENLVQFATILAKGVKYENVVVAYEWLGRFRYVFLESVRWVAGGGILFGLLPWVPYYYRILERKQKSTIPGAEGVNR